MASWCYNQDFKEEEQASGSNEKEMILAVEGEKALTPEDLINKVLKWVITSYIICLGKTRLEQGAHEASMCGRLMPSKQWNKRNHNKIIQEAWYCKCSAKYRVAWGQVFIIEEPDGTVSYVRAEYPSWDNIRAMKTEATVSAERVKELYDKIRSINPSDIVGMDEDGCKYIKKYEDLPFFSSEELLTLMSTFSDRL